MAMAEEELEALRRFVWEPGDVQIVSPVDMDDEDDDEIDDDDQKVLAILRSVTK